MGDLFRVAIHYGNDNGYIEYDPASKNIKVVLGNREKQQAVEKYLHQEHVFRMAKNTLEDFEAETLIPTDSVDALEVVLTHLWEYTEVLVDWSRPISC
ncbi:MAG: hypothetical protein H6Q75_1513 [Firmicutes bacterium]|nr:hypothetical protein [Bacillota bacterium]